MFIISNQTNLFYNKYKNSTTATLLTELNPSNNNNNVIIIDNWKHYLRLLNLLIIISFLCDCFLLLFLIINLIRRYLSSSSSSSLLCNFINTKNRRFTTAAATRTKSEYKKQLSNYVTIAFISHQALIDLMRILYCLFYINNLKFHQSTNTTTAAANEFMSSFANIFYNKYCIHIASFYSILTMVTLINTLTIFICETCRFYDLKLNSNDTSNICCVLFGVMLIWLSALIIISSIMLIGIASSAAPNQCSEYIIQDTSAVTQYQLEQYQQLITTTTTTRTFVINCVWLVIVCLIIAVAIFYSRSLYKELNSLDYKHHRISIYALYSPNRNLKSNTNFQRRHYFIVKHTSKRLVILFALILIFCLTWFPNFFFIILNVFVKSTHWLKVTSLVTSIFWLLNPCFNALVFLCLLVKEYKSDEYINGGNQGQGRRRSSITSDNDDDESNFIIRLFNRFKTKKQSKRGTAARIVHEPQSTLTYIEMQQPNKATPQDQVSTMSRSSSILTKSSNSHHAVTATKKRVDFEELQTKVGTRLGDDNEVSDLFTDHNS